MPSATHGSVSHVIRKDAGLQGLRGRRTHVVRKTGVPGRRGLVQMAQRFAKAIRDQDGMMSTARVYADVNVNRAKDYWDYENLSIDWGWAP